MTIFGQNFEPEHVFERPALSGINTASADAGVSHHLKLLTVSDWEDKALIRMIESRQAPGVDLVISCGDLPPEYLSFLRDRMDAPLYFVKGNHDIRYTRDNPMGCGNIHGRVVSFKSLTILGLEGSMWYNGGPNQYTEAMMKKTLFWMGFRIWRKQPVHMVVTHAAPRGVHDREDLCHRGFECFGRLMEKQQPDYLIHGHVHREYQCFEERVSRVGHTRVINTCGFTFIEV